MPAPPFISECSDQTEAPQTRAEVEQADWLCHQLRGVFVQVCGLGAQGWRAASGQLAAAAKGGFSATRQGQRRGGLHKEPAGLCFVIFVKCLVDLDVLF